MSAARRHRRQRLADLLNGHPELVGERRGERLASRVPAGDLLGAERGEDRADLGDVDVQGGRDALRVAAARTLGAVDRAERVAQPIDVDAQLLGERLAEPARAGHAAAGTPGVLHLVDRGTHRRGVQPELAGQGVGEPVATARTLRAAAFQRRAYLRRAAAETGGERADEIGVTVGARRGLADVLQGGSQRRDADVEPRGEPVDPTAATRPSGRA
jgi:hypothetical protein